jgi:hypothetical protein
VLFFGVKRSWSTSTQESVVAIPQYEVYLGYQYVRSNTLNGSFFNENLGLTENINGFNMHGGDGQFIYNFSQWASFVVDAGGVNKPHIGLPGLISVLAIPPPLSMAGRTSTSAGSTTVSLAFSHLVRSCLATRFGVSAQM